jgi:UDP:flavonoid glycosyltransferase YjiC (YdhE family)
LGTLQNRKWEIFQCIADACVDLDAELTVDRLKQTISQVLDNALYREKAQAMRQVIQASGGVKRAADLIISVL